MEDFKSNAIKPDRPKVDAVEGNNTLVTGRKKIGGNFIVKDLKSSATSVISDYVLPTTKNTLMTSLIKLVQYIFTGGSVNMNNNGMFNYNAISSSKPFFMGNTFGNNKSNNQSAQPTAPMGNGIDAIKYMEFTDRGFLEDVLARMQEFLTQYETVSVGEFYEFIGQTSSLEQTFYNYGWKDLSNAYVDRTGNGGYRIVFPKIVDLSR